MQLPRWAFVLGAIPVGIGVIGVSFLMLDSEGSPSIPTTPYIDSRLRLDSSLTRLQATPTPTPTPSSTPSPTDIPQSTQEPAPVVAEAVPPPETRQSAPLPQSTSAPQPQPTPTPTPTAPPPPEPTPFIQADEALAIAFNWIIDTEDAYWLGGNQLYWPYIWLQADECEAAWDSGIWKIACNYNGPHLPSGQSRGVIHLLVFETTLTVTWGNPQFTDS